jgi:3-oxoacyl-[acyl-carrier protein] reductase
MTDHSKKAGPPDRPVAIVTGAARGIGHAIVSELSRNGYDIAAIDVSWPDTGAEGSPAPVSSAVSAHGARLLALEGDIADLQNHLKWIETIHGEFGRIDLLVNNAGIPPAHRSDLLDLTPDSFDRLHAVNLRGTFFLTQRVARHMVEERSRRSAPCRIIFITSISAVVASRNRGEYCMSKSGLSMAAMLYAERLAAEGIPVFEIRPGIIHTRMTEPVREKYDRMIGEGMVPQNRWGDPEDVAKTVAALAGGAFDYSSGAILEVSGGMNIRRL